MSSHDYWGSRSASASSPRWSWRSCCCADAHRHQHREVGRRPARSSPTKVAGNTANIPQLEATAPVLGLIVEEAVVQDGYMNALTDGFGGQHEQHRLLATLTVILAVIVVRGARRRADRGAPAPGEDLRRASPRSAPRCRASRPSTCARWRARSRPSTRSSTSSSARCRASAARPRSSPRGGRDDPLVDRRRRPARRRPPGRRLPAQRRARARRKSIVPSVQADRRPRRPRGRRTSTPSPLLLTTQDQVAQTVAGVAGYGGSLDVILDDAE